MNGSEHSLLEKVSDDLRYVRNRVDGLDKKVSDLRVQVEHRMTKLEGRTALTALIISAIISLAAVVANCGAGMVAASGAPQPMTMRVTSYTVWTTRTQVPTAYRHIVDWHAWRGPAFIVFAERYACVVSPQTWTLVREGDEVSCAWRGPRGI